MLFVTKHHLKIACDKVFEKNVENHSTIILISVPEVMMKHPMRKMIFCWLDMWSEINNWCDDNTGK